MNSNVIFRKCFGQFVSGGIESSQNGVWDRCRMDGLNGLNLHTPLLVLDEHWEQVFGAVRWRFLDDRSLQLSFGGMLGLKELDWLALAELRYRIGPSHALALGVRIMDGKTNTLGGLFDKNDELFLRYEWFL